MDIPTNIVYPDGLKSLGVNMKAVIVVGNAYTFEAKDFENAYVVGVDKGAFLCLQHHIKMDLAIGDFDSVTSDMRKRIEEECKTIVLNPIKDTTDTMEAIKYCKNMEEIVILGAMQGKRIEHCYANFLLLKKYDMIRLKDDYSYGFTAKEKVILRKEQYKFFSVFSLQEPTYISIKGCKYPLDKYKMNVEDSLGISNEWVEEEIEIDIDGRALIILSKEDKGR